MFILSYVKECRKGDNWHRGDSNLSVGFRLTLWDNGDMSKRVSQNKASTAIEPHQAAAPCDPTWTFLSNHSHVIICLAKDPEIRMRDMAVAVGITERAVIRIITELEEAGYIKKERVGRRNRYTILADKHLRHPLEAHHSIRGILALARK